MAALVAHPKSSAASTLISSIEAVGNLNDLLKGTSVTVIKGLILRPHFVSSVSEVLKIWTR